MIDPKLEGKVALITGANHGIGAATAKKLAAQGAKVFITYYAAPSPYSEEELEEIRQEGEHGILLHHARQRQSPDGVLEEIRTAGGEAVAHPFDLADADNVVKLMDLCEQTFGRVDILVINHTHSALETFDPKLTEESQGEIRLITAESIDHHFAINSRASALLMAEYLQRHIAREATWGRIVTLTSAASHAWNISYAASKKALVSYGQAAAEEMGAYGITVNTVCPGPTQTGYITAEDEQHLADNTPLGRVGQPEDVADVILFLTSEQSRWVTGQVMYTAGGFMMFPS